MARYTASRAPDDFNRIVERHGPMVLRTCMRILNHRADADDAAQSVFLVLAQRPQAVRDNLAGWLHKVAHDASCRIVRERVRRQRREEVKARMAPSSHSPDDSELREELDAALVNLPGTLREAVVLHYLEDRQSEEAARVAGCTPATLRWRAMKGIHRLRAILTRREVVISSVALTAFLIKEAAAAVPAAATLGKLALASGAVAEGSRVATLAHGAVKAMFWAKVKTAAVAVTIGGAAIGVAAPIVAHLPRTPVPATVSVATPAPLGVNVSLGGRRPFPDDSPWNTDISREPVDPQSNVLIASIGRDKPLRANFGPPLEGKPVGIPYMVVAGRQPRVPIRFGTLKAESDRGPYPLPADAPIEGGAEDDIEMRRCLLIDRDDWKLYELIDLHRDGAGWRAEGGAIFDLRSNALRPKGWTAANGAGLPVFPGLVRYDEVGEQKAIRHALSFTCAKTRRAYVAPARHFASKLTDPKLPPMGMRVRLKADFDIAGFPPEARVVLQALKTYGMFLSGHGSDWYLGGTPDDRWNLSVLRSLQRVKGSDFEVVRMGKIETE